MMIYKQILGVQKQTTNIGVLLELGEIPLIIYANKFSVKNWERIRNKRANFLLLSSYKDALNENLTWLSNIRNILEHNGMLIFYIEPDGEKKHLFIIDYSND